MARLVPLFVLTCLALATPGTARAQESPLILRAVGTQPGTIHLLVLGTPGGAVEVAEMVGPVRQPLAAVTVGPGGYVPLLNATPWTCTRSSRRFVATNANGERSYFSLRTPSCRNRVALVVPRRARVGSRVRLRLSDTFSFPSSRVRLCVSPPRGRRRCHSLALRAQGRATRTAFRASGRGYWRVTVSTRHQRTTRTVAVGVPVRGRRLPRVFFTGDSMMQSIDNVIADRLAGRAEAASDVVAGGALSKLSFPVDFVANTRKHVRRLRAAATVVFLGANEGFPLRTATGTVECCDEPWVAAYTSRARRLIRAGGRITALITLPAPRDAERRRISLAVNEGLRRAAARERSARLIDLVPVFTPGFVYRDFLPQRGEDLYVRESDGIHVSIDGAPIVSSLVIKALEDAGTFPSVR